MPGRNGGRLRRGNPGNRSRPRATRVAREVLNAKTPEMAHLLIRAAFEGVNQDGNQLSVSEQLKALTRILDHADVPATGGGIHVAVIPGPPADLNTEQSE